MAEFYEIEPRHFINLTLITSVLFHPDGQTIVGFSGDDERWFNLSDEDRGDLMERLAV